MLAGCAVSPLPQRAFVLDAGDEAMLGVPNHGKFLPLHYAAWKSPFPAVVALVLSSRRTAWMSISPGGGP